MAICNKPATDYAKEYGLTEQDVKSLIEAAELDGFEESGILYVRLEAQGSQIIASDKQAALKSVTHPEHEICKKDSDSFASSDKEMIEAIKARARKEKVSTEESKIIEAKKGLIELARQKFSKMWAATIGFATAFTALAVILIDYDFSDPSAADLVVALQQNADWLEREKMVPRLKVGSANVISRRELVGTVQADGRVKAGADSARIVLVEFETEVEYLDKCFMWKNNLFDCQSNYDNIVSQKSYYSGLLKIRPNSWDVTEIPKGAKKTGKGEIYLAKGSAGWRAWYLVSELNASVRHSDSTFFSLP
jgi:hypothetical protein